MSASTNKPLPPEPNFDELLDDIKDEEAREFTKNIMKHHWEYLCTTTPQDYIDKCKRYKEKREAKRKRRSITGQCRDGRHDECEPMQRFDPMYPWIPEIVCCCSCHKES